MTQRVVVSCGGHARNARWCERVAEPIVVAAVVAVVAVVVVEAVAKSVVIVVAVVVVGGVVGGAVAAAAAGGVQVNVVQWKPSLVALVVHSIHEPLAH